MIGNLKATDNFDAGDNFAGYPWLYCCVNNFGSQRVIRGNMNKLITESFSAITDQSKTAVGVGMIPEGIEDNEILFDIISEVSFSDTYLKKDDIIYMRLKTRYEICPDNTFKAWKILRDEIYVTDVEKPARESSLLTCPSLDVDRVNHYSYGSFTYDTHKLEEALKLLMSDYNLIEKNEPYCLDIIDIARQIIVNRGWYYLEGLQSAFQRKNKKDFTKNSNLFLSLFRLQNNLLSCNRHTMFGEYYKSAISCAATPGEEE